MAASRCITTTSPLSKPAKMISAPITSIKGIGPRRAEGFARLGLFSVEDILHYWPRSYIDYTKSVYMAEAEQGAMAAVRITVLAKAKSVRVRGGLTITSVAATDGAAKLQLVWYNQPYRASDIIEGESYYACGRIDKRRGQKIMNPALYAELPGIVPLYPACSGLPQKVIRDAAIAATEAYKDKITETLPASLIEEYSLMPLGKAIEAMHRPKRFDQLKKAAERVAFEDMLLFSLMLSILRHRREASGGIAFATQGMLEEFLELIPFEPTGAQLAAMRDIERDMGKDMQMNRLIQGDVGSGKTICALFAMYIAIKNGYSAALMAPTEILANQHYETLKKLFGDKAVLLKGSMKKKEKDDTLKKLDSGEALAICGTHAIISGNVKIAGLGLVIADEQHRFGVRQRAAIGEKGVNPDTIIMSATPIPRTISLLMYGDLELSVIDELPPGRKPVATKLVPQSKREDMYRFIERELKLGAQAYAVCPLVDESEALEGVLSANSLYKELSKKLDVTIELMHGKLSAAEKENRAKRFASGETKLLVSTTVVEVGIDVPNATIMVIENADRFGLAQLHQLRGRVGRGSKVSYCFLLSESGAETAKERLSILSNTSDGFEIAERDLAMRGPGELLGARQHGADEFNISSFAADMRAFNMAKEAAEKLILKNDPNDPVMVKAIKLADEKINSIAQN